MLKISVELLPGGDPRLRRTLALLTIANRSDLADVSNYAINGSEAANPLTGKRPWTASAVIADHDRRQSVWALVARAAAALVEADHVEW
ncbi:MAG: hypothetical protein CFE29_01375 [Bradyrhizobiaceae bacterium PARB1]|jgi:hypothetical protein|nr:MAG: hypothetical protein CFE29_01375 [Bradyrhizobiaceae bacterium PARB1]